MRPSLNFDFDKGGIIKLPSDLQKTLNNLDLNDTALKKKIASYIDTTIARRIDNQTDPEGKKWAPRKNPVWDGKRRSKKMLLGMKKTIISIKNGQVSVGYKDMRGVVARWHNEGTQGSDGKRRPARAWLNLSKADIKAINKLITSHLSST